MAPSVLIADDEEVPRAQLASALRAGWPEVGRVHECSNGCDAWDIFLEVGPSCCFLDLRMPGMTGIEVARRIGGRAHVAFVASPGDHALGALDGGGVELVRKPLDANGVAVAAARMRARVAAAEPPPAGLCTLLGGLVQQVRRPVPLSSLRVGVGADTRELPIDDVLCLKADARCTRVVLADGEVLVRTPLKELLALLDPQVFWQIDRTAIVNHRHVAAVLRDEDGDGLVVTLRGRDERLPVSRHFMNLFRDR